LRCLARLGCLVNVPMCSRASESASIGICVVPTHTVSVLAQRFGIWLFQFLSVSPWGLIYQLLSFWQSSTLLLVTPFHVNAVYISVSVSLLDF
jgi:hypothetical protein